MAKNGLKRPKIDESTFLGVCTNNTAPSVSSINRILRNRAAERASIEFSRATSTFGNFYHPAQPHPLQPAGHWPPTSLPPILPPSINPAACTSREPSLSPKTSDAEVKSQQCETEAGQSDFSDDDRPQFRRSRSTFSQSQLKHLEKEFEHSHYPDLKTREELSEKTGLSEARIQVHTVRNLHFLSKNSTLISRENCRFFLG